MKPCNEFLELLSLQLDGEASPEQNEQVEKHLPTCLGCQRARAAMGGIAPALQSLTILENPPLPSPRQSPIRWTSLAPSLFYQLASLLGVCLWLSTATRPGGDLYYWFTYPLVYLWFFLGTQLRSAGWRRAHQREQLSAAGLEYVFEPFRASWMLSLTGMLAMHLKHSNWSPSMSITADATLLALAPLAGALMPPRWRGPGALAGLVVLYLARSLPLSGLFVLLGLGAILLRQTGKALWLRYTPAKLAFDASGLGMLLYLYALTPSTLLVRHRPEGEPDLLRSGLEYSQWTLPFMVLAGWLLLRTPLFSLLELARGGVAERLARLALGLWLALGAGLVLNADAYLSDPARAVQPWPFGAFYWISLLALPLGLWAGRRLGRPNQPLSEQRKEQLRGRILMSAGLNLLSLVSLGFVILSSAAELPDPGVLPTLYTRQNSTQGGDWLERQANAWREYRFEGGPQEKKAFLQARLAEFRPLRESFLKELADHPEVRQTVAGHKLPFYLNILGLEQELSHRPDRALDYYLQANKLSNSTTVYLLALLEQHTLSAADLQRLLREFQSTPTTAFGLDVNFAEWRDKVLKTNLPDFYVQAEIQIAADAFLEVRNAFLQDRPFPEAQPVGRFPWALHTYPYLEHLYRYDAKDLQRELHSRKEIRVLAALELYRLQTGAYPRQLQEVQTLVPEMKLQALQYRLLAEGPRLWKAAPTP